MTHLRQTLLNTFVAVLRAGDGISYSVQIGRTNPIAAERLPVIIVYSKDEEIERDNLSFPRSLTRAFKIQAEIVVSNADPEQAEIDTNNILENIETRLGADNTLGGACRDSWLETVEMAREGDNEASVLVMTVCYLFELRTVENAPGTQA